MNAARETRTQRHQREHAESRAKLRSLAGRPLPPRRTRIALATAYLMATAAAVTLPSMMGEPWASLTQIALLVALAGLWLALRRATHLVTEAPDDVLDELLVRLRDGYFREAYQLLGVAAMLAAVVLQIGSDLGGLPSQLATAVGWALFSLVLGLPLAVAAYRLPNIDDEA